MPKVVLDFQLGTIYMVNQQLTHPSVGPPPVLTPLSMTKPLAEGLGVTVRC